MTYNHFHEIDDNPETNEHLAEIMRSIEVNGWQGLPLLTLDGENLVNGCHRSTACEILGVEPEVHTAEITCTWGDSELADYLLTNLADARSTDDILKALKDMFAEGLVDKRSLDIMQAEYDKE